MCHLSWAGPGAMAKVYGGMPWAEQQVALPSATEGKNGDRETEEPCTCRTVLPSRISFNAFGRSTAFCGAPIQESGRYCWWIKRWEKSEPIKSCATWIQFLPSTVFGRISHRPGGSGSACPGGYARHTTGVDDICWWGSLKLPTKISVPLGKPPPTPEIFQGRTSHLMLEKPRELRMEGKDWKQNRSPPTLHLYPGQFVGQKKLAVWLFERHFKFCQHNLVTNSTPAPTVLQKISKS